MPESPVTEGSDGVTKLEAICRQRGIQVIRGNRLLARLSERESFLAVAVFRKRAFRLQAHEDHLVLVEPADMGNLGTIARTMAGFGVADLAIIGGGADHFHPRVVRSSMGALFSLRVQRFADRESYLREHGNHLCYPFFVDGTLSLRKIQWEHPASLIFGNEGIGLERAWHETGKSIRIDHSDRIDSLNLSLAVGIALYELRS